MTKKQRQEVFDKFGGRCAYCGCELGKGWHLDHIEPVCRKFKMVSACWKNKETKQEITINEMNKMDLPHEDMYGVTAKWKFYERREVPDGFYYPERDTVENALPACASCNINKHGDSIEGFRATITKFVESLNNYSVQYKVAKRYGLIQETQKPVVFYFEQLKQQQDATTGNKG